MMNHRRLIAMAAGVSSVLVQLTSPAVAQVPPTARYVIQPSDTVAITYRYSPEYDFTGPVLPDGYVNPPLLGEIRAAGLTLEQFRDSVLTKARERLRDPEIVVLLKDFEKPAFSVGGQVDKPGRFELRGRTGVLEGIAMAGGLKTSAKDSQVVLFRRYDEETAITRLINVKDLTRAKNPERNFDLQAGDFIFVPQNKLSKIERLVPLASLALLNPLVWR
jgi:polysaccharide biosynthesis/export protein